MPDKPMTNAEVRQELYKLAKILGDDNKYQGLKFESLFQYLRLSAGYIKFDLEATKRELKYLQTHRG